VIGNGHDGIDNSAHVTLLSSNTCTQPSRAM